MSAYVLHGCVFTPRGIEMVDPPPQPSHYRCETILERQPLSARRGQEVGVPDSNYVLDWGDVIYGYEGMVRGTPGLSSNQRRPGTPQSGRYAAASPCRPPIVKVYYAAPIRCYYHWRNQHPYFLDVSLQR